MNRLERNRFRNGSKRHIVYKLHYKAKGMICSRDLVQVKVGASQSRPHLDHKSISGQRTLDRFRAHKKFVRA